MNREFGQTSSQIPLSDNDNKLNWSQFVNNSKSEIITILGLDKNIESNIIAAKLLIDGRQVLSNYEKNISPQIYHQQMTSDQSELLEVLKNYFDRQWHTTTDDWFQTFLHEQKAIVPKIYDQLLTYSADYGSKLLQDNFYLSLTIRLLFDFKDPTVPSFTQIWNALTTQGFSVLKQYQGYFASKANENLLKDDRNPLYMALEDYYRQALINLLKENDVNMNRSGLIENILTCIVNNGWRNGFDDPKVRDEIPVNKLKQLIESLPSISNDSSVIHLNIVTTATELPSPHPTLSTESPINVVLSTESSVQRNELETKPKVMTIMKDPSPPIILSRPIEVPNTYSIHEQPKYEVDSSVRQKDASPSPTPSTIVEVKNEEEPTEENGLILKFMNQKTKLQLSDLVQAGELIYIDKNFDQVITKIIEEYQVHKTFSLLIDACFIPLMYLLKRQQNLDGFIDILFSKSVEILSLLTTFNLSLRMLIDLLLLRSDFSLSRKIFLLLSKRNPVPFLQSSLRFVSDIIDIWNYSTPTLLSFGIGPCQGKSLLLNGIFLSSFEQSVSSIYFQNTIDIDFGYNFLPRRSINIADAHGSMTKSLLEQIHLLFDGFLIHVEYSYLRDHLSEISELLNLINKTKNYRLLIIRDVTNPNECRNFLLSKEFSSIGTYILTNISDQNKKENKKSIIALRDQILDQSSSICLSHPDTIKNRLLCLTNSQYQQHLTEISQTLHPLKSHLSDIVNNPKLISKYFPEYLQFVELCKLKSRLAHMNFYGNDNDATIYDLRSRIFQLESTLQTKRQSCSIIYQLFFEVLTKSDSLTCLDILTTDLRQQRAQLITIGDMAKDLPIEKNLSLEVLWRNAIICCQCLSANNQKVLQERYYQYIQAGYPFEIIDGDNFFFQYSFLLEALTPLRNHRTLVISIIGPQNSGKSTLLNYMFGTLFDVRDGRCTRGIYGSFVKSNQADYDYILLIDTEGLLGIEREDKEYDRRIVLFCLAVSHIVLINVASEMSVTLQEMLKLCADSLTKMNGTQIPSAIIHFILNQKIDLNINNNHAAIQKMINELKADGLDSFVNIGAETFHTLPSAFKKEGQTLTSKSTSLNQVKTTPDFLDCVQLLSGKIFNSIRLTEFSDPLQWLSASITIFETLLKSSDLSYYRDIHEQRVDNQIREHIREILLEKFSTNFREELIRQTFDKNEDEMQRIFLHQQNQIEEQTRQDLGKLFKFLKVSHPIQNRNEQFLRVQIIEMFNTLRTSTIEHHRREQVNQIIHHAEEQLRQSIANVIRNGRQMTREIAEQEFERMYQNTMEFIKKKFNPKECLEQAMNYIYTNYYIYEKECVLELFLINNHSSLLTDHGSMNTLEENFLSYFTNLAYQKSSIVARHFNPNDTSVYSFDIINSLIYLNRNLLEREFRAFLNQSNSQMQNNSRWHDNDQGRSNSFLYHQSDERNNGYPISTSTDPFQMKVRNEIQQQGQLGLYQSQINEQNMYLGLSRIIREVIQRMIQIIQGGNDHQIRQIRTELIQKIVGLINSLLIDIKNELDPFCLELSMDFKLILHQMAIIVLTQYYYYEQINHFNQILANFERKKSDLRNSFLTNISSNNSRDNTYASSLAQQLKEHLFQSLLNYGQQIITEDLKQYECLNRKWIQDRIDGQLGVNNDMNWYLDYISNPTKIIEQFFIELWLNIKKEVDQNLLEQKRFYMKILKEFFYCIEGMLDNVRHLGAQNKLIDEIFQSERNLLNMNEDLRNKNQCMVMVLFQYLVEQRISLSFMVNETVYYIRSDAFNAFQSLVQQRRPSDELAKIISEISSVFTNISISNLTIFLEALLMEREKILVDFDQYKCDFKSIDRQDTYATLLDKVRGCPDLCPCCRRPCDVDHTQIKSNPGSGGNEHRCQSGHSLRAMNGYKFEITDEPSLFMCEQIEDDQILVIGPRRYRWSDFKRYHSDWIFQSTLNNHELNRLHGKFLTIWRKIGKELCQKYQMKYVHYNTTLDIAHQSFHYILLLDGSGSMKGQRWQDLLNAVQEFLTRRSALKTYDRISIIVFSNSAHTIYSDEDILDINIRNIPYQDGTTSFHAAFECVNQCITYSKRKAMINSVHNRFVLIFMSDGEDRYPDNSLNHLLREHSSVIKRFWTLALGSNQSSPMHILKKINEKMNGSFMDIATSADLVKAYAEIASSVE